MEYKKRVTAAKVAVPAVVMMAGAPVVQWVGKNLLGIDVPDDMSYNIIIGIFSFAAGVKNWWTNRKKR